MSRGSVPGSRQVGTRALVRWSRGALAVLLAGVAAYVLPHALPDRSGLGSRAATKQVLRRLGIRWTHLSPPVVILSYSSDDSAAILLASFENLQMPCVRRNVDQIPEARAVLLEISKDRWGRRVEPVLPTLIIGTRVLRDATSWPAIEKAYRRESDWETIL